MKLCPACQRTYLNVYKRCPRDGTALVPFHNTLRVGSIVRGKYEVLDQLGAGGMASVYKVRHLAFKDLAAIKVVHKELMGDQFLKRFRNEAVVARQLKHPNAVRVEDFDFTDDGEPFIVMEYVEGRSLYEVGRGGVVGVGEGLRIAVGVAWALEAAHALGIVHRDIKPSNVMLTGGDGVKVLDFGVAKVAGAGFAGMTAVETQVSMIVGTPEYMSPEQATVADETMIDGRSDLYSLGVVLYELVTGVHPFRAETPIGMLMHQVQSTPMAPASLASSVSPAVSALILKALRKRPEDRFQTATEMLAALRDPEGWYGVQAPVMGEAATEGVVFATQASVNSPSARLRRMSSTERPVSRQFVADPSPVMVARVRRGRSWPVLLLLMLLLMALAAAVIWFYGEEHPGSTSGRHLSLFWADSKPYPTPEKCAKYSKHGT